MDKLGKELTKLNDDAFQALIKEVNQKRTATAQRRNKPKILPKPEQIPAKEFDSFVARTKALFLGQKVKTQTKLVLQVEVNQHVAWVDDARPRNVSIDIRVSSKDLEGSWILKAIGETLTDYYADQENLRQGSAAWKQMQQEITTLLDEIEAKEKNLGLPDRSIWEAVYDRCAKFSQH